MLDWDKANDYLFEVEKQYRAIGFAGEFALSIVITPLIKRFNNGERTETLYNQIMSLE